MNRTCAVMDIGSNAIRILWGSQYKFQTQRIPLRLGQDAFSKGLITPHVGQLLHEVVECFAQIIEKKNIKYYRAIGTSALRDAQNGKKLIQDIKKKTNIQIEIIDALEEARLVQIAIEQHISIENKKALVLDIGGGSAEYVLLNNQKRIDFFTEKLGTVRLIKCLEKKKKEVSWENLDNYISDHLGHLKKYKNYFNISPDNKIFISTGGNPRAIGKLAKKLKLEKTAQSISHKSLTDLILILDSLDYNRRIKKLGLEEDRADVILPAATVLLKTMDFLNFPRAHFPPAGLKEGLIYDLQN